MTTNKHIILDRDGVINVELDGYVTRAEDWQAIPGSYEAIRLLNQAGYKIGVATNQAGIAKGLYAEAELERIHSRMLEEVEIAGGAIDIIRYCPHTDEHQCQCRKPLPGMLHHIADHFGLSNLNDIAFVGDNVTDLQAATAAGAKGILVKTGFGERMLQRHPEITAPVFSNLLTYVHNLLKTE